MYMIYSDDLMIREIRLIFCVEFVIFSKCLLIYFYMNIFMEGNLCLHTFMKKNLILSNYKCKIKNIVYVCILTNTVCMSQKTICFTMCSILLLLIIFFRLTNLYFVTGITHNNFITYCVCYIGYKRLLYSQLKQQMFFLDTIKLWI